MGDFGGVFWVEVFCFDVSREGYVDFFSIGGDSV